MPSGLVPVRRAPALLLISLLIALLGVVGSVSCVDPREASVADALAVAGPWTLSDDAQAVFCALAVESGPADVVLQCEKRSPFAGETALLEALPPEAREALENALELGAGQDPVLFEAEGGDNLSFDGGETASLTLLGVTHVVDDGARTLRWGLAVRGDADRLEGTLFVTEASTTADPGTPDGERRQANRIGVSVVLTRTPEAG